MKPYFVKYLPIDGVIKEHSLVFKDNELATVVHVYIDGSLELESSSKTFFSPSDEVKLAKLFLCNRDANTWKKGNVVFTDSGYFKGIMTDDYKPDYPVPVKWNDFKGGQITFKTQDASVFKVIGEISPEATWVKEGDEYLFGKIDKNGYICPYNQENEEYIKFWTERGFRDLPNI